MDQHSTRVSARQAPAGWVSARLVAALAGAALCLLAAAGPAAAHAELRDSEPAASARLPSAPGQVVLTFSGEVSLVSGGIRLLDGAGAEVPGLGEPTVDGARLTVPLPPSLPDGGYLLSWRVISADSHPVAGALPFAVGASSRLPGTDGGGSTLAGQPDGGGAPAVLLGVARWLGYLGTAGLLGGLLLVRVLGRSRRLALGGGALVAGSAVLGLAGYGPYATGAGLGAMLSGESWSAVAGGAFGWAGAARLGLAAAVCALVLARRDPPTLIAPLGLAVCLTFAAQGHARGASQPLLAVGLDALHVLAMSLWLGGLAMLVVLARRAGRPPAPAVRGSPDLRRWSWLATGCVAVLALTGAVAALREVEGWDGLWTTRYGGLLVAKLVLVAALLAVAVGARRRVLGDAGPAHLRRRVLGEAGIAAVVLAVTAALVGTTPTADWSGEVPGEHGGTASSAGSAPLGRAALPDGSVVIASLVPGRLLTVMVHDSADQMVRPQRIRAAATSDEHPVADLPIQLLEHGDVWMAHAPLPYPGRWTIRLTVQLSKLDVQVAEVAVLASPHPTTTREESPQ